MKLPKVKTKKTNEFLKRLPRTLGDKAFLTFLVFLLMALIFGGIIFYKYNILIKKVQPEIVEKPIQFKEKAYQDVLKTWQGKEERFKETDLKQYPDPFKVPAITE